MFAADNGHVETAKALVKAGARVNEVNRDGCTALMLAAQYGHTETVVQLLVCGAAIDAATKDGHTALSIALCRGHEATASVLKKRADRLAAEKVYDAMLSIATRILRPQ
jgi:ankyrin repeat protein